MLEKLYEEHFKEVSGANNLENYSETDVDRVLSRMLKFLPNDGSLYKYRKGEGSAFENAYDSLEKGYIWLAKASTLNDDVDTTINFDPQKDIEDVKAYLRGHPITVLKWVFSKTEESGELLFGWDETQNDLFRVVLSCYDEETGIIDKGSAIKLFRLYGCGERESISTISKIDNFVKTYFIKNERVLEEIATNFLSINKTTREMAYIFSLSECCDSDAMWAYYAENKGFCIEYDFKKVLGLPLENKRLFMGLYKVIYQDERERLSFLPDLKYFLGGYKDKELLAESNIKKISQLIMKQEKWKHEREWRLFLCNVENVLYADLVSAIYIDQAMMETDNGKKLLELAKARGWKVFVRRLNYIGTAHEFIRR